MDSLSDMAGAIIVVSKLFGSEGSSTPEHCNKAIALLEDDGDFSDEEEVEVMGLFAGNMAVADTFLSIHKKNVCTTFICSQSKITNFNLIILTMSSPYAPSSCPILHMVVALKKLIC